MPTLVATVFAQAVSLSVGDTSRLAAHRIDETNGYEARTTPNATLFVETRRVNYSLAYTPSFTQYWGEAVDANFALFHTGQANATMNFRRATATLSQTVTYGKENFRLRLQPVTAPEEQQDPTGPTPGQPPDTVDGQNTSLNEVVYSVSSTTSLGMGYQLTRRHALTAWSAYNISKGLGASREAYPYQRQISGGLGLGYSLTRNDVLTTELRGGRTYTDPDIVVTYGDLTESWGRTFQSGLTLSLAAGFYYTRTETSEGVQEEELAFGLGPAGNITVSYPWSSGGARYILSLSTGVAPETDRLTGIGDPRATWNASLFRIKRRLTLSIQTSGASSLYRDRDTAVTLAAVEAGASYQVLRELYLDAGLAMSGQNLVQDDSKTYIYTGFIGFTYQPSRIRL